MNLFFFFCFNFTGSFQGCLWDSWPLTQAQSESILDRIQTIRAPPGDPQSWYLFRDSHGILVGSFRDSCPSVQVESESILDRIQTIGAPPGGPRCWRPYRDCYRAGSWLDLGGILSEVWGWVERGRCEPVALTLQPNRISRLVTSELLDL